MDEVYNVLKKAGLRATEQRARVYSALQEMEHATVDEVVGIVRSTMPTVTVAAVYNILEAFVKVGLVGRLYAQGVKMYDIIPCCHAHAVIDNGKIMDLNKMSDTLSDTDMNDMIKDYVNKCLPEGYSVSGVRVFVRLEHKA